MCTGYKTRKKIWTVYNTFLAYFTQSTDEVNWKTRIALMF